MELDGLALNELRLESLNAQTVERRRTVEEDGVALHHILKNVPDNRLSTINYFLGTLDGLDNAALYQLANDERLVEFCRHERRQAALAHLQLWSDDNHRAG